MKEQLVTFETAKLAEEKGFKEYEGGTLFFCEGDKNKLLMITGSLADSYSEIYYEKETGDILCPTQSLLQKWLREKHNLHISVDIEYESDKWRVNITDTTKWEWILSGLSEDELFNTFEEALEDGLKQALTLIK